VDSWIRECHACGEAIPAADFEHHRAFMILKRDYCGSCADRITRRRNSFPVLVLPALRDHPRMTAAVAISVALLALLFAWLARMQPPAS
jgi:hypothetical protein